MRACLAERFLAKVDGSGGDAACWPWRGTVTAQGYGQIWSKGRHRNATRISWELAHGPIPPGMFVLHACDNPPCVNPGHLFIGTHADNMRDMRAKGRDRPSPRTQRKLTEAAVREARSLWASGVHVAELARRFGVAHPTMKNVVEGVSWRNV